MLIANYIDNFWFELL